MRLSKTYEVLKNQFNFKFNDANLPDDLKKQMATKYNSPSLDLSTCEAINGALEDLAKISAKAQNGFLGDIEAGQLAQTIGQKIMPAVRALLQKVPESDAQKNNAMALVEGYQAYLVAVETATIGIVEGRGAQAVGINLGQQKIDAGANNRELVQLQFIKLTLYRQ